VTLNAPWLHLDAQRLISLDEFNRRSSFTLAGDEPSSGCMAVRGCEVRAFSCPRGRRTDADRVLPPANELATARLFATDADGVRSVEIGSRKGSHLPALEPDAKRLAVLSR